MSAAKRCIHCPRRTWSAKRICKDCRRALKQRAYDHVNGLHGGRWVLDKRTRVQRWMPDPVVMSPSEWAALKREKERA